MYTRELRRAAEVPQPAQDVAPAGAQPREPAAGRHPARGHAVRVQRYTCHVSYTRVMCRYSAQQPPDGPDAAGAGRGAAEGGAGEQLQLRGGGVRPLPRGQCSPIVTSIYVTPSLFSSLKKLNIAFALGNLFIETIIILC